MKKVNFNLDWLFKKENGSSQAVTLPHDAMIHEKRDPDSPGGSALAFFPGGKYIYEKKFHVPSEWKNQNILIEFEGVYQKAKVYVNDKEAGGRPYGYIPFCVAIDPFLSIGQDNMIRVEVDNEDLPNSRWYSGAGIYRPVWVHIAPKTHIEFEGVKITTLSYHPSKVQVKTSTTGGTVRVVIKDGDKIIARGEGDDIVFDIPSAKLWSDETPYLYTCSVTLVENGETVDEITENFGIRKVEWSNKGLFINGKETLLRGGCIHHDNGILGAATYAKSEERRVLIMKENGYNAIRSSHNPASKALLDSCDKYGMYVMDETWDMWYGHKSKYDYATIFEANYKEDIKAMVDRDYNHPSVIMYSIGNEISEPAKEKGVALTKEMTEYIHELDNSRAVTAGVNLMIINLASKGKGIYKEEGGLSNEKAESKYTKPKKEKASGSTFFNMMTYLVGTNMTKAANSKGADLITSPCLDVLDISGYNYASGRYPLEAKAHPDRIVVGSETFTQDIAKNWEMVKKFPYLVGDFMWTSWDYLGEVGVGTWAYTSDGRAFAKPYPWLLADVGTIDILGNPGAGAAYAKIVWGLEKKPYIGVRPVNHPGVKPAKAVWRGTNAFDSWAWKNCEGNKAEVEVYADASFVELYLNDKKIGRKRLKSYKTLFKVKYAPGRLKAIAFDSNGTELSRNELLSATGKVKIQIKPQEETVKVGEIAYIDVTIMGENQVVECNSDSKLTVKVEGGELLAFGSANPRTEEQYTTGSFTTYYGRAQAIVRAIQPGIIRITASGNDNSQAKTEIIATT
jgi:hypothetical protein